jgi:hypothetical protein
MIEETRQLRHHIPIAAPSTREPATGDEPFVRVSLGFTPRWYHARLGMDLGERWHLDPEYRYETIVQAKEYLHETFPSVPYFTPEYDERGVERTAATISGVYGILVVPMLYGIEPVYWSDNWPDAKPGGQLSKEAIAALPPPDPASAPHIRALLEQMDWIERKAGSVPGYLNYQGVLNIALKVRGNGIFLDMLDDPEWAKRFFRHIGESMARTASLVQERQQRSGFPSGVFTVSNCVMNMVSPDQYEEYVLPIDLSLSARFPTFGVHTCNWDATPYLEKLRAIGKMGYLDMGTMSDLEQTKRLFPTTRRSVLFGPVDLENKDEAEIYADLERIATDYGPCDVALADVETTTPDERVRYFLEAAAEISTEYGETL